jgi:hypothetical protein
LTQPDHAEFPLGWSKPDKGGSLARAIFMASRSRLVNALLIERIHLDKIADDRRGALFLLGW